jgi:hypothetical protein
MKHGLLLGLPAALVLVVAGANDVGQAQTDGVLAQHLDEIGAMAPRLCDENGENCALDDPSDLWSAGIGARHAMHELRDLWKARNWKANPSATSVPKQELFVLPFQINRMAEWDVEGIRIELYRRCTGELAVPPWDVAPTPEDCEEVMP